MVTKERRKAPRAPGHLLASLRRKEDGVVTWSGFARTLNLSVAGALLESPDKFKEDEVLVLEFLLDDDQIAEVNGVVNRISRAKGMYHVAVEFPKLTAKARRLIAKQIAA